MAECSCQTTQVDTASHSAPPVPHAPVVTPADIDALVASCGRYLHDANRVRLSGTLLADATVSDTWHAYLTVEGLQTTDQRAIAVDGLTWRDLPLPLRAAFQDEGGHWGAVLVGAIDTIERQMVNGMSMIYATGRFDMGGPNGQEAARLCGAQFLRWVSVDLELIESEWVWPVGEDPYDDMWFFWGNEGIETARRSAMQLGDGYEYMLQARIAGCTMVDIPAFPQAVICPSAMALPVVEPMGEAPIVLPGMVASGEPRYAINPPSSFFDNPELGELTPLTITPDGRVFGHLAPWGACHVGYPGQCVTAPRGSDYRYFMLGQTECEDGLLIRTGKLTLAGGHADASADWRPAAQHYDDTNSAFADVVMGEDDFGPWVSGALRPHVDDAIIRTALASPLSGDWRPIEGVLELIAACCVNVPGFPLVASVNRAGIREGTVRSLIASNPKRRNPFAEMMRRIDGLETALGLLTPMMKDALDERLSIGR